MSLIGRAGLTLVLALGIALAGGAMARAATDCAAPVPTAEGSVTGTSEPNGVCVWRGIPYAAPPVGERRWRPPAPALKRDATLAATAFTRQCLQPGGNPQNSSEDCLYLNVWRPTSPGKYPVMVWIHGGGLIGGNGNYGLGDRLAERRGVVVVSINYRLGPLGFLALPELRAEDPNQSVGNYGLLDQVAALRWVHDNIAGFGGDPGNVLIFGCSAGGWSVCNLLGTPRAAGLFHRAIIESGGCDIVETVEEGYATSARYAEAVGCAGDNRLECLRALPSEKLRAAINGNNGRSAEQLAEEKKRGRGMLDFARWPWRPHIDGYVLNETPLAAIQSGRFNRVPVIAGAGRDEFIAFNPWKVGIHFMRPSRVRRILEEAVGEDEAAVIGMLYPRSDYRDPGDAAVAAIGDMAFGCRCYEAVKAAAQWVPAYHYRFDFDCRMMSHLVGAGHCGSNSFSFDFFDRSWDRASYLPWQQAQALKLQPVAAGFWSNFSRNGDPNGAGLPEWPAFTADRHLSMILDVPARAEDLKMEEKCDFWRTNETPLK